MMQHLFSTQASDERSKTPASNVSPAGSQMQAQMSESHRPGKFPGLQGFFDGVHPVFDYHPRVTWATQRGCIIHIRAPDPETRLHDRVMLVTGCGDLSMTCYTLCRHDDEPVPADHWKVTTSVHTGTTPDSAILPERELQIRFPNGQLKDGIMINLVDPWNVEFDQNHVAKIGFVPPDEFGKFAERAVQHLSSRMGLPELPDATRDVPRSPVREEGRLGAPTAQTTHAASEPVKKHRKSPAAAVHQTGKRRKRYGF